MNSLEKKLIASMAAVVVLLLAAGIITLKALDETIEINQEVSNTREMLMEVESTLLTFKSSESDQQGYIADARSDALERVGVARERARARLERIKSLSANNPRHQEKLAKVEPAIYNKFEKAHRDISLRQDEKALIAKAEDVSDEQKLEMDRVSNLLGEITAEEQETLQRRLVLSEQSVQNVTRSFGALFTLILFLLFLVFFLVKKELSMQRQLRDELNHLATVDELTSLYNRRELNRRFDDEVERFRRYQQPFSLLLIDVDHFKKVNDTHGHPVGDKVLRSVAAEIRDGIRTIDVAGRFGGEEFAVILPNTSGDAAFTIADRLRKTIAKQAFTIRDADLNTIEVSITVSIGVSAMSDDKAEDHVFRTADSALYQAKEQGRNKTVLFEGPIVRTLPRSVATVGLSM